MKEYRLSTPFSPAGDQPRAIKELTEKFRSGHSRELLLGATGTGKTFVTAHLIKKLNLPTLIIAHNKTLAGQLYGELRQLFPEDNVGYFISFYDYYQPEAYIPTTDTYIEKDASRNDDIDRMRHFATSKLSEERKTIVVASVSCIYGIGSPDTYKSMSVDLIAGEILSIADLAKKLVGIQYERTRFELRRGTFRVNGDIVDIFPPHEDNISLRLSYFDDEIEEIALFRVTDGKKLRNLPAVKVYPSSHYVAEKRTLEKTIRKVSAECEKHLKNFRERGKLLEAQRLEERIKQDIEMLKTTGYCNGIENYSRYLTGREEGEPPPTLIDYFGDNFLTVIDESHMTIPQIKGMFRGDRSRKQVLVDYGFRLPSALDNRPLMFDEFDKRLDKVIYLSATPSDYERQTAHSITELINRPTGLVDPKITVHPASGEIDILHDELYEETGKGGKVLVTALTKKMAEDVTEYLSRRSVRAKYLHSDIDSIERLKLIMELRKDMFDVLVGVNLLREGLDIPEVSLVAILDADKEGFLRSASAIIQTIGRAARNVSGRVLLFGDKTTAAMKKAIEETDRRRSIQMDFNKTNNVTPKSISGKAILDIEAWIPGKIRTKKEKTDRKTIMRKIKELETDMKQAAREWDFEYAAILRDKIFEYKGIINSKKN